MEHAVGANVLLPISIIIPPLAVSQIAAGADRVVNSAIDEATVAHDSEEQGV